MIHDGIQWKHRREDRQSEESRKGTEEIRDLELPCTVQEVHADLGMKSLANKFEYEHHTSNLRSSSSTVL